MHPDLLSVIEVFRRDQDMAVAILRDRLGVSPPTSNLEWAKSLNCHELAERGWEAGIKVRSHGFGIEIKLHGLSIDFDWGANGEANGFDAWRLWNHCRENRVFLDRVSDDLLRAYLKQAHEALELVKDGSLYYLPQERPRRTQESAETADP
jgi:hypothetical protein